jgi:hypothetical protein
MTRRREALERSDGLLVVAELRVVIVLDHHPAHLLGSLQQCQPPLRGEDHAGWGLVGRRDDVSGRIRPGELVDDQAAVVDGDEDRVDARPAHEDRHVQVTRVLDGDRSGARGSQVQPG